MNIPETCKLLDEYVRDLTTITDKLTAARTERALAEAKYLDAKNESFLSRVTTMSATALAQYITSDTTEAKKALLLKDCEVKNLESDLSVIETANNNLKMKAKLTDLEIKNLNLQ